jgi:hypothetical protein
VFVADRLRAMLAHRPRLAFQAGDLPIVTQEMLDLSLEVAGCWEDILSQVRSRLSTEIA